MTNDEAKAVIVDFIRGGSPSTESIGVQHARMLGLLPPVAPTPEPEAKPEPVAEAAPTPTPDSLEQLLPELNRLEREMALFAGGYHAGKAAK